MCPVQPVDAEKAAQASGPVSGAPRNVVRDGSPGRVPPKELRAAWSWVPRKPLRILRDSPARGNGSAAPDIDAHDFPVVAKIKQTVAKCGSLSRGLQEGLSPEFLVLFRRRANDYQFTLHRGEKQFAIGRDQVAFSETWFLPDSPSGSCFHACQVRCWAGASHIIEAIQVAIQ